MDDPYPNGRPRVAFCGIDITVTDRDSARNLLMKRLITFAAPNGTEIHDARTARPDGEQAMIETNQLRFASTRPRVAQAHRLGRVIDIARLVVIILCILAVASCASVTTETPYNLGVAAFKKRDYSEAAAQWTKAVAHGDTEAMNNLGYLLYNGYGVDIDIDRAVKLWRDAAVQGESESQWHLGRAHETGIGAERNLPIAYAWYQCAIATVSKNLTGQTRNHTTEIQILQDAKGSLDKMQDKLSAADLERGRALAAEYIGKYGKPAPEQPHR